MANQQNFMLLRPTSAATQFPGPELIDFANPASTYLAVYALGAWTVEGGGGSIQWSFTPETVGGTYRLFARDSLADDSTYIMAQDDVLAISLNDPGGNEDSRVCGSGQNLGTVTLVNNGVLPTMVYEVSYKRTA